MASDQVESLQPKRWQKITPEQQRAEFEALLRSPYLINVNYFSRSTTIKIPVLLGERLRGRTRSFSRLSFLLKVLAFQLSCLLLAESDVGPGDVVDVNRIVEP